MVNRPAEGSPVEARSALLIYVEPTPYRLGLIRNIAQCLTVSPEVLFIASNVSQQWNLTLNETSAAYLPAGTLAAAYEIGRRLATGRYRLVQLAGWSGRGVLICAWLLAWWHRVPIFVESDTQLPLGLPLWKRVVKRLVYPLLFRIPRKVFAAGSRQAAYFRYYGVDSERIVIDQMTVDVSDIMSRSNALREKVSMADLRKEFGLRAGQTVFIFVGRLELYKGIGCLLEAFGKLSQLNPEASILIVGDGPERARVEAAAKGNESILYAGRLDYEKVIRAYNCSSVAVVPSLFEPWGLVVNEAMAVGLPVIASDRVGCVDDLVRHDKTGLVFPSDSTEALRVSMCQLLQDPQKCNAMGAAGRQLISGWTLEHQARKIVAAWEA